MNAFTFVQSITKNLVKDILDQKIDSSFVKMAVLQSSERLDQVGAQANIIAYESKWKNKKQVTSWILDFFSSNPIRNDMKIFSIKQVLMKNKKLLDIFNKHNVYV